jgi:hypothetical protein
MKFVIPGRLSGTNEIIKNAAWNRYSGGAQRKKEKEKCYWAILEQFRGADAFCVPVTLAFSWIEPNAKRDLDNITGGQKVMIDALVMAGIIPNDTREWIKGISHTFPAPDKKNPRIEMTVEVHE